MGKKREFSKPKVPAYLVSFGDMMTILLTFFILLCTYATTKTSGFVSDGVGSFRMAIQQLGMPAFLMSDREVVRFDQDRIKYRTKERENEGDRDQDTRRISDEREQFRIAKVKPLKIGQELRIEVSIRFRPGTAELSPGHDETLRAIAGIVASSGRHAEILGHADREHLAPLDRLRLAMRRSTRIVSLLHEDHGAPTTKITAGAAAGSRIGEGDSPPDGDITLRVYRPGD